MKRRLDATGQKLKSKLPSKDKEKLKRACSTGIGVLQTTLNVVQQIAGNAGLPGLQAGIKGLILVLDVAQKMSQNAQDIEQLTKRMDGLLSLLQNAKDRGMLSDATLSRIDCLSANWIAIADEVRKMTSRNLLERAVHYNDDVQSLSGHVKMITWSIESFTVESMLAIEFTLDEQVYAVRRIEGKLDNVAQQVETGLEQLNAKLDVKDGRPPYAVFARFDCKDRPRCLEGTRMNILEEVYEWMNAGDATALSGLTKSAIQNLRIFWVNGSAGTGKTTIAYTIAETCRRRGVLGASFFCSRDNAECSNPNLIFPTIAYQLGLFFAPFQTEVARAVQANPDIGYSSVSYQCEELIVKPLRALGKTFPSCVIVLDALDECKDGGATSIILSSLSRYIDELWPLKILVTSRPERNITLPFSKQLNASTQRLILHEVELKVVETDIEHYLAASLAVVRDSHHLDDSWPSKADVHALAVLSVGLFIFASTSLEFIKDPNYSDPGYQLSELLSNTSKTINPPLLPHQRLDQLYTDVLMRAFPDMSHRLAGRLKMVLGTIILLRDPLSLSALEQLLNLKEGTVRETLACLHSVVIVPEDDNQVIRLHHPSFFDFMTDPTRCMNPKLVVDSRTQHTLLARECLKIMKDLRRDICRIRDASFANNEVDDLQTRISRYIPPQLQYACRHWSFHLANGMISDVLLDLLKEFCSKYLLYWVEGCSLLGELRGALLGLDSTRKFLAVMSISDKTTDMTGLLYDCERFTREFFSIISTHSLQVYDSALLFTPKETLLYKKYQHELLLPLKVYSGSGKTWNSCIRTIDGHFGKVNSVAFSPDGTCIASGSADKTVRLWDAVSGTHLNTLEGHTGDINSVTFSPDGGRVVSGSDDKTVRLWDVVSGTHLNTLDGHSGSVNSVAFSPDGSLVMSVSDDNTVRLWDAASGAHLNTLEGHLWCINSVAFSPDGSRVVSGSDDDTVRLWDAVSGAHLTTLNGHSGSVFSVAFSGNHVVSGSYDNTVRLWDAVSGAHLNTLEGHVGSVYSVNFSLDGGRVVSGSDDNTVQLWDTVSGTHLNTLDGHSGSVNSVAFSLDGSRVVSGSDDNTVRLWDAVSGAHLNTLEGHPWCINSVAFSPDGGRVVSGSDDSNVRLWDAVSGAHLNTLEGHSGSVYSVAFSPDGNHVVSGSYDNTVRLWDAVSGTHVNTLEGHTGWVSSVNFSSDGSRVMSGSYDNTVRLWDVVSGAQLDAMETRWTHTTSIADSLTISRSSFSRPCSVESSSPIRPTPIYFVEEEWVCCLPQKRRLLWIPVSCRPSDSKDCVACNRSRVAWGTRDGRVVTINLAGMDSYLNPL